MTRDFEFKQRGHLNPALAGPAALNAEKLVGRWLNTNPDTRGLAEVVVGRSGGGIKVRAVGVGAGGPVEWPAAEARVMANLEEEAGQRGAALSAAFDFDYMRAETYVRLNKGVLVVVLYVTFLDDSGRSDYVSREFFYRTS
jgi:hypothetical protein